MEPNDRYLANLGLGLESQSAVFNSKIIDPSSATQLRRQYEQMMDEYELRRNQNLVAPYDDRSYFDRTVDFTRYILRHIFAYQMTENMKKAEKNSENIRTFQKVQAQVQAIANGSTSVQVSEQFRFGTQTNIPDQRGRLWMTSALVDGSVDVTTKEIDPLKPYDFERYSLSFSRPLPVFSLQSGLRYGGTTTNLTASLSRALTPNLSAAVASSQGMDRARTNLPPEGERSVSLNYGIAF